MIKGKEIVLHIPMEGEAYEFFYKDNIIFSSKEVEEAIKFAEKKVTQGYRMTYVRNKKDELNGVELG